MKFRLPAIIGALILSHNISFSQDGLANRWQVELRPGVGIPVGDFADKTYELNPPGIRRYGLAKTGLAGNLAISYEVKKDIGITIIAGYGLNKQDGKAFETGPNSAGTPYEEKATTHSWNIGRLMAGGWWQTSPVHARGPRLRLRLAAGLCKTTIPGYSYVRIDNPGSANTLINAYSNGKIKVDPAFCYEGGLQLMQQVAKQFTVSFGTSFFQSTVKDRFRGYITPTQTVERKQDYNIGILTCDLGIHFSF